MDYSKYIYKTAGCPALGDWAIKNKLKVPWGKAKRGDIVLFDFNRNGTSDHVGIVTGVGSGYVDTIEGNTGSGSNTNGNGVYRRYRSQVNYFVRTKCPDIEAVIRRAEAELGYREGRNNSNKYGKWFGVNHQPWCCQFVVYCFAHAKGKPKPVTAISKPAGKYTGAIPSPTIKKGSKGTKVKDLQKFLNWYGSFKLAVDGDCGSETVKAIKVFQKTEGLTADGIYGAKSQAKAKAYKAAGSKSKPEDAIKPAPAASGTPKADKIVAKIRELAWAYGTATKKYRYPTGAPQAAMKTAMAKYGYTTKIKQSDCGYCVNTIVREAIDGSFKVLAGVKEKFPEGSEFAVVHKGKAIPDGLLKPGDIIRYKKTGGSQHKLFYYGDGKIAEGGRKIRFFVIKKDEGKYNRANVKRLTIEVLRVKE